MATWGRVARALAQAGARGLARPAAAAAGEAQAAGRASHTALTQQSRGMASGHHGESVTYGGLTIHKPERWQVMWGEGLAGLMWFWVFVRFYHDGEGLLFGHAAHFEHEEEHESHGAHGHTEHGADGHAEEPAAVPPSNTEDVLAEKGATAPA